MLHLSRWIASAVLSLAPLQGDSSWLDHVPANADVVIRTKGLESSRTELVAMLKAMSPTLGEQAAAGMEQGIAQFKQLYGEQAVTQPFVTMLRVVPVEDPAKPPFAILVKSAKYEEVITAVTGGVALKLTKEAEGVDSFPTASGQTWYASKSGEFLAFGPDRPLVSGVARAEPNSIGKVATPAIKRRFEAGDAAFYVNVKALTERYGEQIGQAKKTFLALLDQAGNQAGNASMMAMVKNMYASMFDAVNDVDGLVLSFDFDQAQLIVDAGLIVKEGTSGARLISAAQLDSADAVAKLPAGDAYYVYLDLDAKSYRDLQKLGLRMLSSTEKSNAESDALLAKLQTSGRIKTFGSTSMDQGMKSLSIMETKDPKGLLQLSELAFKAMKTEDGPLNFFKQVEIVPNAGTHAGFTFTKTETKLDFEKLAKLQPTNPMVVEQFKRMYGGDTVTTWVGINETQMIQIVQPTWEKVQKAIDDYNKGGETIGKAKGFSAVRSKLPNRVGAMMLVSIQGMLAQMAAQFGQAAPVDLPAEPAFVGMSISTEAPGLLDLRLVVPSTVGPVLEKGAAPIVRGMMGGAKP